ncbi:alpha/beta fold hydrolase [Aeromonas cavernicola]|uniref:Alpha/beta hydrolase n=1 Tax=Aeromonas cavernicola TaxID=1006623 RepID=A0A2H9U2G5_9GAMM|nr:alpha/beta fold hydrolase [Aeromonas cavernicola]PJG58247.1 alpha/beta hydrolase [Aeromonas cavernicola]
MTVLQHSLFIPCGEHQLHMRYLQPERPVHREPVLLLHGALENGRIFYTESGKGLACFLAQHGFHVYVADLRGRGLSRPPIAMQPDHGQHELITEDLPTLQRWVAERHSRCQVHWIAHSWGGVIMASTLARFPVFAEQVASLTFFGSKRAISVHGVERWLKVDLVWNRLAPLLARRKGFLAARTLTIGADDEPVRYLQETIPWVNGGPWHDPLDGFAYDVAAAQLNWPPLWMICAKADKVLGHPMDVRRFALEMGAKMRYTQLGRDNGNRCDYDHINMLTAPQAPEDHFPQLLPWLASPHVT